ncbi:AraC family transcriptional regulator [Kitasatospora sp. RB6PN24]|uniref:AraC family transcriptional regulator n=1 Tax=Kitasatospora humi TaxID=2893891 RepID=UPI001E5F5E9A|nr:AraC family transcriptional regulator [Kitasatospora humi]MCC9312285.1 AraC family transcriptional regulator [Kitasatospora humi]
MDVLSDAITAMRTGRPHAGHHRRAAPWGVRFPAGDGVGFHAVLDGEAWLHPPGDTAPVRMTAGDLVLLPHGTSYGIADAPGRTLRPAVLDPDGRLRPQPPQAGPGTAASSSMLCGAYLLNQARPHPLLTELPPQLHLTTGDGRHPRLRTVTDLLADELTDRQPGTDAVLPALLDTLLLHVLRAWYAEQADAERPGSGWAHALRDRTISTALHAIHDDPAHPWTVEELGARAGLSRAAFARRFTTLVGRPPLAYLTWWRMTTAGRLLRESDAPLRTIAQRTGYLSEFAFAKAFKREYGVSPGRYRSAVHLEGRTGRRTALPARTGG